VVKRNGAIYCTVCLLEQAAESSFQDKVTAARSNASTGRLSPQQMRYLAITSVALIPLVGLIIVGIMAMMNSASPFERQWGGWIIHQKQTTDAAVVALGDIEGRVTALQQQRDREQAGRLRQSLQNAADVYRDIINRSAGQPIRNPELIAAIQQADAAERRLARCIYSLARLSGSSRPAARPDLGLVPGGDAPAEP
jgi:hypothetical protein